jgi:hypothetical protein
MTCPEITAFLASEPGAHFLASLASLGLLAYYLFRIAPVLRPPISILAVAVALWAVLTFQCILWKVLKDLQTWFIEFIPILTSLN